MSGIGQLQEGRRDYRRLTVAAVTLAVNLGSFAYLVLVARSASPAVFGALAALAGIALLFEVPANALQVAVGRALASAPDRAAGPAAGWPATAAGRPGTAAGKVEARPLLVQASIWGLGVCLVLLALSPLVERFLHLPSVTSALAARGVRPAGRRERGAQGRPGRAGPAPAAGHRASSPGSPSGSGSASGWSAMAAGSTAPSWPWSAGEVVTAVIVLLGLREFLDRPTPSSAERPVSRPVRATMLEDGSTRLAVEVGRRQVGGRRLHRLLDPDGHRRRPGPALAGDGGVRLVRGRGHHGPDRPVGAGGHRRSHLSPAGGRRRAPPGRTGQPAQPAPHVRPRVGHRSCHRLRRRRGRERLGLWDREGLVRARLRRGEPASSGS